MAGREKMNGKISKFGDLWIERPNEMVQMRCRESGTVCSHNCPAFHEPVVMAARQTLLKLCAKVGTLDFYELKDERGKHD